MEKKGYITLLGLCWDCFRALEEKTPKGKKMAIYKNNLTILELFLNKQLHENAKNFIKKWLDLNLDFNYFEEKNEFDLFLNLHELFYELAGEFHERLK